MENEPLRAEKYYRDALQYWLGNSQDENVTDPVCAELHHLITEAAHAGAEKVQKDI